MRNKNILIAAAFGIATVLSISVTAQKRMLEIYQNGKVSHSVEVADIDSIKINSKLQAPPTVEATVTEKGIVVKWTAVEGATDYDVFRSPDNTAYTVIEENVNGTSYTDKSPFSGINYYKIRANGSDGLTSPLSNASSPVSTSGAIARTGLYMGIIGFNQELTSKEISILAPNTKTAFTGFVSGLTSKNGTLLYYAVDNAIDKLSAAILPDDLVNVSIVTFTDGLDQGSMMMNPDYASDSEYLSALNERIGSVKVHGLPITAYSIGLKGNDVTDENKFMENLQNLASAPENAAEVSSMEEVNAKFQEIAEQLYNISSSQTINLKIPGQSNGTVIRFTFDNVADAAQSEIYIEGTFSLQDRTLKEITYKGLSCSSGATVTGTQDGIFVTFSFTDLKQITGDAVPTNFIKQWSYLPSTSQWQINSEFTPEDNTVTTIDRKSAVIMLVLDCSSSLGSQFSNMQTHANQFIEKMAENTEPTTGGGTVASGEMDVISELSMDELVFVEGGTFLMGAQSDYAPEYDWQGIQSSRSLNYDPSAEDTESPVHEVTLSSYYIGKYEVTQALWEYVMNYEGTTPDGTALVPVGNGPWLHDSKPSGGGNYPAYNVSYDDITNYFLPRLNKITGKNFRLPTEAEWEYAARGGQNDEYTRTHTSLTPTIECSGTYYRYGGTDNLSDVAWYRNNDGYKHLVGQKNPNPLGLYDMLGNVREWCSDWYSIYTPLSQLNPQGSETGTQKIVRGGYYSSYSYDTRVSYREVTEPDYYNGYIGFRLACSVF